MRDHGTLACYTFGPNPGGDHRLGCRCRPCRDAKNAYELNRQRMQHRPDMVWLPYVPAGRARRHAENLSKQGMGWKVVAEKAGVSHGCMWKLIYGKNGKPSKRIRPETEAKILAVTIDDADGAQRIDATRTWQLLNDLLEQGFYKTWLAEHIHGPSSRALQIRGDRVHASTARKVERLHARWSGQTPPRKRSRHDADRRAA